MSGFRCPNCSAAQTVEAVERAAGRVVCHSCGASTSLEVSDPFGQDELVDLPAPKSKFADLPAPVGAPAARTPGTPLALDDDLPAPVFRGRSQPIDNVPSRAPAAARPAPPPLPPPVHDNLPAPVRASPGHSPVHENLPAPKARVELPDLLAPVVAGPPPLPNLPDNLPAPKGDPFSPQSSAHDNLPAPKGFFDDALAPKSTPFGAGASNGPANLPAPKGFFDDAVAPKNDPFAPTGAGNLPAPKGFFDDAVAPKNDPFAAKGAGSLPAPKGFFDDAVAPKNDPFGSTGPDNLPAPKGIFDDLAPPQTMGAPTPGGLDLGEPLDLGNPLGAPGAKPLDLGEPLDLGAPMSSPVSSPSLDAAGMEKLELGRTGHTAPPPLDLGAPQRPFGLDDLELEAPAVGPGSASPDDAFAGVALPGAGPAAAPQAPPSNDGVVSFSQPSDSAVAAGQQGFVRRRPVEDGPLELDDSPVPSDQAAQARKTLARDRRSGVSAAPPTQKSKKRRTLALVAVAGVMALGAGGFYGYTKWSASKETSKAVASGVAEARKHLIADRPGHWGAAIAASKRALAADAENGDAIALGAQAQFGAALDTGVDIPGKVAQGKRLTARLRKAAAQGPEVQKAEGLQALVEGRGGDALKSFGQARKANPRDSSLDLYVGWAHLATGNFAVAEGSFAKALKSSPGRVAALYGLGRAQQGQAKTEEARASFQAAVEKSRERYKLDHVGALVGAAELAEVERFTDRENRYLEILGRGDLAKSDPRARSRAWTLAGNEALRAGRLQEATQRFTKALELDGTNRAAVVGDGKALLVMSRYSEARERLTKVLNVDANDLDASLALAEVALREEKLTESKELITRILERKPPVEDKAMLSGAHRVLAGALALEPNSDAKAESEYREAIKLAHEHDIRAALDLANFFVSRKRGEEAKAVLEPIRDRAKKDPGISVSLGVAYLGAGDPIAAEQTLRGALELRPGDPEARFQLGQSLLAQKRTDEGLAAIKAAYEANRSREDIGLALAVAYEQNKRNKDAAALYETLLTAEAPSLNVKARAGRYFARHGAVARAIGLGEEILAESKSNPAGLFLLGEKHFQANEFDKAQRAFLDASSLDKQAQYFEGAGRAAERQRSFDDSLRHYQEALLLEPDYLSALYGQARIYMGRRAFQEAIGALDKAIALGGKDAFSHFGRGVSLIELGKLKDGVSALSRAVKLDPKLSEAHYRLGRAYFDLDKARASAGALAKATTTANGDEPWLTEAYRVAGYANRMARNRRAAISAFRAYFQRNPPKGPQRTDAKRELLFLEGGGR